MNLTDSLKRIKLDNQPYPSDEHFIPGFLSQPCVFSYKGSFYPRNSFVNGRHCVFYVRFDCSDVTHFKLKTIDKIGNFNIRKTHDKWSVEANRKMDEVKAKEINGSYDTLAEVVAVFQKHFPFIQTIHYVRGIIDNRPHPIFRYEKDELKYPFEKEYLLKQPIGTYLYFSDSYSRDVLIKTTEENISIFKFNATLYEGKYLENIDEYTKEELSKLSVFKHMPNLDLKICKSVLDVSLLGRLGFNSFLLALNSWTPELLNGVEILYFNKEFKDEHNEFLNLYVELIIYLAKNNRTNIQLFINISKTSAEIKSDGYCNVILRRMRAELEGEGLNWAMGKFLEVIFYNTYSSKPNLLLPLVNDSLQELFHVDMKQNFKIVLKDSQREILVHDYILMRFSAMMSRCIEGNWNESINGEFTFKEYSDEVVEQFIWIAYGFEPDLSQCDLIELLEFAHFVEAPLFTNLINKVFNESTSDLNIETIKTLIVTKVWEMLPQKQAFFESVGTHWSKIIESVPVEDRSKFREDFMDDWRKSLTSPPIPTLVENKPAEYLKSLI